LVKVAKSTAQLIALIALLALALMVPHAAAQDMRLERDRARAMLKIVAKEIEDNFYDQNLHGLDWKTLTEQTRQRIDTATTLGDLVTAIFSLVNKLQDSHTAFLPPARAVSYLYGFKAKPFGDQILVYEVKNDSAAAAAGLQVGDRLFKVNGFRAERNTFDLMMLYYRILRPAPEMEVLFSRGNEAPQTVRVKAKVKHEPIITDLTKIDNLFRLLNELEAQQQEYGYRDYGDGVGYLSLPSFTTSELFLSGLAENVKGDRAFVIDLRNNPGGAVKILNYFVGLFEAEPTVI